MGILLAMSPVVNHQGGSTVVASRLRPPEAKWYHADALALVVINPIVVTMLCVVRAAALSEE